MARKGKFKSDEVAIVYSKVHTVISSHCKKMALCGSYRRNCEYVGDLDFVVIPFDLTNLQNAIYSIAEEVITDGERSCRIIVAGEVPIQVDFMYVAEDYFESAVLHSTGSKWFNIKCRQKAQRLGLRLSQYGLLNGNGEKVVSTEIDILKMLGMAGFSSPETRSI